MTNKELAWAWLFFRGNPTYLYVKDSSGNNIKTLSKDWLNKL